MDLSQVRDLLTQVQAGARVTAAVGEPIQVGERVVIPVVEVAYGGGGGGGGGKSTGDETGSGGGGGGGIRVHPLGCWIVGPHDERWVPAVDPNRVIVLAGTIFTLALLTMRAIFKRH